MMVVVCSENASHFSSLKKKEFHKNVSRDLGTLRETQTEENYSSQMEEGFLMKSDRLRNERFIRAKRVKPSDSLPWPRAAVVAVSSSKTLSFNYNSI